MRFFFFFSSRRRHTRLQGDWSSDVCSSDLLVGKYGEGNPVGFFRDFMQNTVIPHSQVFAQLTAFGEVAVGLGLTCGFLTALAAGLGLFLVANYGLAVQWQGSAQQGFHYMLIVSLVVILSARA